MIGTPVYKRRFRQDPRAQCMQDRTRIICMELVAVFLFLILKVLKAIWH